MTDAECWPAWEEALARILERPGLVIVLGAPDTGKTTFVCRMVNRAIEAGLSTAVVDADVGQSEIGPPTCVSFGIATEPVEQLSQVRPHASGFVGSTSPEGALLDHLSQTCRMVAEARRHGPALIVCDTTGLAPMPWSDALKRAKIDALQPDHIVFLARDGTTSSLARGLRLMTNTQAHFLSVPPWVTIKPPQFRAQRREWRLAQALAGGTVRSWRLEEVVLENTWLGSGKPLSAAALQQLSEEADQKIIYGEVLAKRLGVVVREGGDPEKLRTASERLYSTSFIAILRMSFLESLLVALLDGNRSFLALGLFAGLDGASRTLRIWTPIISPTAVRIVRFGYVKCTREGQVTALTRGRDA